jgi:hypothetical protein
MGSLAALALLAMGDHGVAELSRIAEGGGPPATIAAQVLASGPVVSHPCPNLVAP